MQPLWLGTASVDQHVAFRFSFSTSQPDTAVSIAHAGASWYNVFIDGRSVGEGPTRFLGTQPYHDSCSVTLPAGPHTVAFHAHSVAEQTRLQLLTPPFVCCNVQSAGVQLPTSSKCSQLTQYQSQWRRMSGLLGWMECCALDSTLALWKAPQFDDSTWAAPVAVSSISAPVPLPIGAASSMQGELQQISSGILWERYGYVNDDPAARFSLRLLSPEGTTNTDYGAPQGLWFRFDALRCQLLRPLLQLSAPAGAMIEICYCQSLVDGKGSPFHPLCGTPSCYIDRYTVSADLHNVPTTICPLEPRGCRYIEMHILSDEHTIDLSQVKLLAASALYRCYSAYHAQPQGDFSSTSDGDLSRIWSVGADTTRCVPTQIWSRSFDCGMYRSCVEDVCVDGPCRERGQWLGDSAAVTLPNLVYMYASLPSSIHSGTELHILRYDDLGPAKLLLMQTLSAADPNGVTLDALHSAANLQSSLRGSGSGLFRQLPRIWRHRRLRSAVVRRVRAVCFCIRSLSLYQHHRELTVRASVGLGDLTTTGQLYPGAQKCMDYFLGSSCYKSDVGFNPPGLGLVIDWGYTDTHLFDVNLCLNALLCSALSAMVNVAKMLGDSTVSSKYETALAAHVKLVAETIGLPQVDGEMSEWVVIQPQELGDSVDFDKIGFHASVLLLRAGLFSGHDQIEQNCCEFVLGRLNSMFPINKDAPRLADPSCRSSEGFYTPYFQTFTFEALLVSGATDEVLGQIQQAWGWALTQASTWLEVFDPRWEAVHSWGGCPTWQMSKHFLGLSPRLDVGARHFVLSLHVGHKLSDCKGNVPARAGDALAVSWSRVTGGVLYKLVVTSDVFIMGWPSEPHSWVQLGSGTHSAIVSNYV